MNLNKVFVLGNITKDPELKKLPTGKSVTSFSVASNRSWIDKETHEKREQAEYHNMVVFGPMADTICKYMKRGNQILVEGRLQTRSWEKDGKKNYRTEIVLENFQFGAKATGTKATPTPAPATRRGPTDANPIQIDDSDIPF